MRPRTLVLTLLFWWELSGLRHFARRTGICATQLIRPISSQRPLWSDPVTAHGSGFGADEQNNIDIYKTNRLATVNVTSVVTSAISSFRSTRKRAWAPASSSTTTGEIVTN
jgi:hypothetical protein